MTDRALEKREGDEAPHKPGGDGSKQSSETPGHLWRIGSASLFLIILVLDLIALDDITTASAWMPEILFLLASIPALVTAGYFTIRKSPTRKSLPPGEPDKTLEP